MATRAPRAVEEEQLGGEARFNTGICKPFTLEIHRFGAGDIKLIWWYIAAVNEDEPFQEGLQKNERFAVGFYSFTGVLEKLTFQMDRDMVKKAIKNITSTLSK
ncbi:MAG: hypothetical protein Q9184_001989 [Pyrenodesmia sp. 2 TL-2023]